MGLNESTPKLNLIIDHERFTRSQLNPQSTLIESFIPVDYSHFDYNYWLKNLSEIKKDPNSKFLFLPLSYSPITSSFQCNTSPLLKLSFDNHPFLLESQINNRSKNHQENYFDETELWLLLYSLVKSQKAFSNLSLKVGDIHPHSIFINEEGYPRLACQFSWPNQKTNFQKMSYEKKLCFLSPEQFNLLEQGQCPDTCYSNTSEAFSIGMTLISTGLLESLDRYCDMRTFKFNHKYLEYCINRWMTLKFKRSQTNETVSYSDELKDIVKNLCNMNKQQRYLCSRVYELLQPYEEKILSLEKFQLKDYLQAKKGLSPHVNYSNGNHYESFFNHYAAVSESKINSQIHTNKSQQYKNTNVGTFVSLGSKKYKELGGEKDVKARQVVAPHSYQLMNQIPKLSTEANINQTQINSIKHNNDLLARIQQQIKQSRQIYPQNNK